MVISMIIYLTKETKENMKEFDACAFMLNCWTQSIY